MVHADTEFVRVLMNCVNINAEWTMFAEKQVNVLFKEYSSLYSEVTFPLISFMI